MGETWTKQLVWVGFNCTILKKILRIKMEWDSYRKIWLWHLWVLLKLYTCILKDFNSFYKTQKRSMKVGFLNRQLTKFITNLANRRSLSNMLFCRRRLIEMGRRTCWGEVPASLAEFQSSPEIMDNPTVQLINHRFILKLILTYNWSTWLH